MPIPMYIGIEISPVKPTANEPFPTDSDTGETPVIRLAAVPQVDLLEN